MSWKVPFFDLLLGDEEKQAVLQVIESNWLTAGPKIAEFESAFSTAAGGEAGAVALSSATAALHLSMLALGIGPGDEVIVPSLTFVASANAIRYVGATPVFADITSESDWNVSPQDVEAKITPRTRAIMVVHYAGYACDMDRFVAIAQKHNLLLVEDCSHAPLGTWKGQALGTFGDTGCFSFFSNKNMTTGEGGMVISRNKELVERFRILRSHGITASTYQRFKGHAYGYDVAELGYNYRLDEIRAAMGIEQLRKLSGFNALRKERVERYRGLIAEKLPQVRVPFASRSTDSSYHIFPVLLPGDDELRNNTLRLMGEMGIQCSMHYRPIHRFTSYEGTVANVPLTDRIADSILTLPLFPTLSNEQMDLVITTLGECL
ncbi:MAG TPA: DegT/DnrJ/EryC1/StrS family aminotransferase [Methylophilaceae bacterium]|jgi:dTDP-4-amino-4,6-dideoxygalactose transaminase